MQKASAHVPSVLERLGQGPSRAVSRIRSLRDDIARRPRPARAANVAARRMHARPRPLRTAPFDAFLNRLRHIPSALSADRRGAPLLVVALLAVAAAFAQGTFGSSAPTGGTDGMGVPSNVRIAALDMTGVIGDTQQAATYTGADVPDLAAAPAGSAAPTPAVAGNNAYAIDGSLIKPLAIDTSVPDISSKVEVYTVRSGDTLTGIAHRYGLSMMTIWWANHLQAADRLHIGQKLLIPPVNGVLYKVQEGDTLAAVAKRFRANPEEIISFNSLVGDTVIIGQDIMVPDGRGQPLPTPKPEPTTASSGNQGSGGGGGGGDGGNGGGGGAIGGPCTTCSFSGSMTWPVGGGGGYISQYYWWGHPAIDIAADYGTPVVAADSGVVIFSGWRDNGGGYQVWISHGNDIYTTYNHMSALTVSTGQQVARGQQVGRVGMTGSATGPHLHFEVWIGPIWSGGYRVNPLSYVGH